MHVYFNRNWYWSSNPTCSFIVFVRWIHFYVNHWHFGEMFSIYELYVMLSTTNSPFTHISFKWIAVNIFFSLSEGMKWQKLFDWTLIIIIIIIIIGSIIMNIPILPNWKDWHGRWRNNMRNNQANEQSNHKHNLWSDRLWSSMVLSLPTALVVSNPTDTKLDINPPY